MISLKINNFDYIDYGASYLEKKIFKNYKKNTRFDLSNLLQKYQRQ